MTRNPLAAIPSIEQLLQRGDMHALVQLHGHGPVRDSLRAASQALRRQVGRGAGTMPDNAADVLAQRVQRDFARVEQSSLRSMYNLSGTVLHTNLGRAVLPTQAVQAMRDAALQPVNLEFDLITGTRGDRDSHVESLLQQITGAEAATVVNNNAAAVMLCLNSVALNREVPVSRGELVEIGGSFRIPQIMASAGCRLIEVGTTNRTHLADYERAINADTAALMTVDPSNYVVRGFTSKLNKSDIAKIAHQNDVPLIDDLGSGSLINLDGYGLPHETTVQESLAAGADLVTFSGDKLLGGPQAGIIAGRKDLIARIKRNPMKRAMRLDKLRMAALRAVLKLYLTPDTLPTQLPTLQLLTRGQHEIAAVASRLTHAMRDELGGLASFEQISCLSQIGSGSLPEDVLPSSGIAIDPICESSKGQTLNHWTRALRGLPRPVLGRIQKNRLILDMRTLMPDDEPPFIAQLPGLKQALSGNPC